MAGCWPLCSPIPIQASRTLLMWPEGSDYLLLSNLYFYTGRLLRCSISRREVWQPADLAFVLLDPTVLGSSFTMMVSPPAGCLLLWIDIIFFPEKKQSVYIMWTLTNKVFFCCFWKWEAPWLCIKLGHSLSPSKLHYFSNFSSSFILPRNLLDFHFILDVKYFSKRYLALIALILLDVCASFIQIIYSH